MSRRSSGKKIPGGLALRLWLLLQWVVSTAFVVAAGNGKENFNLHKMNLADSEALMREIMAHIEHLRAQALGYLQTAQVNNAPLLRGVDQFHQLQLWEIQECLSAMGQLRLSRVRNIVKHEIQWRWILERLGIDPKWAIPKEDKHRSVRTAARWLCNEVSPQQVQMIFDMLPSAEMLQGLATAEAHQHVQQMNTALTQSGGLLGAMGHQLQLGNGAPYGQPSFPALTNGEGNTPGGASSWQAPPMPMPMAAPAGVAVGLMQTSTQSQGLFGCAVSQLPTPTAPSAPTGLSGRPDPNAQDAEPPEGEKPAPAEEPEPIVLGESQSPNSKPKAKAKASAKSSAKEGACSPKAPPMKRQRM